MLSKAGFLSESGNMIIYECAQDEENKAQNQTGNKNDGGFFAPGAVLFTEEKERDNYRKSAETGHGQNKKYGHQSVQDSVPSLSSELKNK